MKISFTTSSQFFFPIAKYWPAAQTTTWVPKPFWDTAWPHIFLMGYAAPADPLPLPNMPWVDSASLHRQNKGVPLDKVGNTMILLGISLWSSQSSHLKRANTLNFPSTTDTTSEQSQHISQLFQWAKCRNSSTSCGLHPLLHVLSWQKEKLVLHYAWPRKDTGLLQSSKYNPPLNKQQ